MMSRNFPYLITKSVVHLTKILLIKRVLFCRILTRVTY